MQRSDPSSSWRARAGGNRLILRKGLAAALFLTVGACSPHPAPAANSLGPAEAAASPGNLVRLPDGRRINLRCSGDGAPTVLLEPGFAATSLAWGKVQPLVARTNRVCAYDRAGYGFSDPGPMPRDGAAVARDLDRALKAARIEGPFIVVGHSAGGLYARLFSNRRPHDVVGMVLAETSVEHQDRRFAGLLGPNASSLEGMRARALRCQRAAEQRLLPSDDPALVACMPKARAGQSPVVAAARRAEALRSSTWRTQVSELDSLWSRTSLAVSRGRQSYDAMPLVVLTGADAFAEVPEPPREAIRALWADLHREIAARSSRGTARFVSGAGHMIILDRPDAVAAAVGEVSAAWRIDQAGDKSRAGGTARAALDGRSK